MTEAVGMTKQAFFQSVLEAVRELPISELIRDKYKIPAGVCPFHKDKTPGSFSCRDQYQTFRCWSCQAKGDAIQFVQDMEKIGFEQSVMKLAVLFDAITEGQAESYFRGTGFEEVVIRKVRSYATRVYEDYGAYRATNSVIHNVLSLLMEGETILGDDRPLLNEAHLLHLSERELDEEAIKRGEYFTMPSRTSRYIRVFFEELEKRYGYAPEMVEGVPGFYKMNDKPEGKQYTFVTKKGIGIPIRDADGMVAGIQIRRDKMKKGESRYIWLSSAFANKEEDLSFGTGSQSPIHVSYPKENKFPNVVFLTEGVFKSEAIARAYQATAMSLQGILNWKQDLFRTLEIIEDIEQEKIEHLYMAFDSDIRSNIHVFEATRDIIMNLYERNEYGDPMKVYYAWWDGDFGKGIDDLIIAGHQKQMSKIDGHDFIVAYEKAISTLEERLQMEVKDAIVEYGNECLIEVFDEFVRPLFSH